MGVEFDLHGCPHLVLAASGPPRTHWPFVCFWAAQLAGQDGRRPPLPFSTSTVPINRALGPTPPPWFDEWLDGHVVSRLIEERERLARATGRVGDTVWCGNQSTSTPQLEHVTDVYKRYLEGRFRNAFSLEGTPLRIEMKTSHNPYADKD